MRARRLFAVQTTQGPQFVALNRMDARRAPLAAADVQSAGGELNLVPLKVAQLAGPQAMPKGEDFEATIDSARAFLYAASVMLLVRRIARASARVVMPRAANPIYVSPLQIGTK
jgi:hypothetical protein